MLTGSDQAIELTEKKPPCYNGGSHMGSQTCCRIAPFEEPAAAAGRLKTRELRLSYATYLSPQSTPACQNAWVPQPHEQQVRPPCSETPARQGTQTPDPIRSRIPWTTAFPRPHASSNQKSISGSMMPERGRPVDSYRSSTAPTSWVIAASVSLSASDLEMRCVEISSSAGSGRVSGRTRVYSQAGMSWFTPGLAQELEAALKSPLNWEVCWSL